MSKNCGHQCEIFQRVIGYYQVRDNANPGKLEEYKMRKMFILPLLTKEDVKSAVSTEEKEMLHDESVFVVTP